MITRRKKDPVVSALQCFVLVFRYLVLSLPGGGGGGTPDSSDGDDGMG